MRDSGSGERQLYGCARKDPPGTIEPITRLDSTMSGQRQNTSAEDTEHGQDELQFR